MTGLASFGGEDLSRFGDAIRGFAYGSRTMESAAGSIADLFWSGLREDGETPDCALVRVYKTHQYAKLPADLQAFAAGVLEAEPDPETRCLTLLATRGIEPAWNDRRQSEGHQAIPLPSVDFVGRLPMVAGLIGQLGLEFADVVQPSRHRIAELAQKTYGVFHVADAESSPHVPAKEFVGRYGIRSALGFGGVLFTGDFFAVVLFSRVPVSPETADTVRVLSLASRVALMPFGTRVFDDDSATASQALLQR